MKIDTKPLGIGKNSIEVAGSWGQVDKADELMIALYSIDADQSDMVKSLKSEREMMKKAMEFFKDIFHLNTKEANVVFNKVDGQTMNLYISYVCGLVKGAAEQSFADFKKSVETTSAPKEQPSETPKEQ
ncbi:phage tail tube assembly chaperone [Limosilactobacillus difficilis]|uniref:phage tail tube assembly chaperone n=1 Tax=Limosilactobacillus difficilis TaxID=2991838 RepID=UPI0024BAEDD2|nr:phage tail tube assembly chaperone [Limosilactobacillus difficilis]